MRAAPLQSGFRLPLTSDRWPQLATSCRQLNKPQHDQSSINKHTGAILKAHVIAGQTTCDAASRSGDHSSSNSHRKT